MTSGGSSVTVGAKPTLVSIVDGNAARKSDEPFIVGQININPNSNASATSTSSTMKGPGRRAGLRIKQLPNPQVKELCVPQ